MCIFIGMSYAVCPDSAAHETAAAAPEPGDAGRGGQTAAETVGGRRRVPPSAGAGRAENVRRLQHVRRDVRTGQLLSARVRPQFAGDGAAHVHAVLRQRDRVRDISVYRPVRRRREYTRNECVSARLYPKGGGGEGEPKLSHRKKFRETTSFCF